MLWNQYKKSVKGTNILILGVAYKKDIMDIRESPALDVIKLLEKDGAKLIFNDPFVPEIRWDGTMVEIDVMSHQLVPKHEVIFEDEIGAVLKHYNLKKEQLPKILITDPCVKRINGKVGDIIKITRESRTAGLSKFYRCVIDIV